MNVSKQNVLFTMLTAMILLFSIFISNIPASAVQQNHGFDKGVSYKSVVPLKKINFVDFDKESLLDDYAYLASVPSAVFTENNRIYSNPLIFYQDKLEDVGDNKRILDSYRGIDYFMEDWMSYCNGRLDQMTLVNVPKSKIDSSWDADEYVMIDGDDPFSIANQIALQEWSYSDEAVVAVIDEKYENPKIENTGEIKGEIPSGLKTKKKEFEVKKPPIGVGPNYKWFDVSDAYKYIVVNMFWENVAIDLDLQLYDSDRMMADASSKWNIFYGAGEDVSSYIYQPGEWGVGVTYMPTKKKSTFSFNDIKDILDNNNTNSKLIGKINPAPGSVKQMGLFGGSDTQNVEVFLYPGVEMPIDDPTPYGCRDAEFKLTWNNPNVDLGFVIIDTSGAETASTPSSTEIIDSVLSGEKLGNKELTINIDKLGETKEDERYKICVFSLSEITSDVDFTVEYSWKQSMSREEGDNLASATEGAVLSSVTNSPLLYINKDKVSDETKNVLYKLGVDDIYLVDLGGYASKDVKKELDNIGNVKKFIEYKKIYDEIKEKTGRHDVIFSTVDPWTYYHSEKAIPVGEYEGARFIGPAAFLAAQHGSPVLLVDNHPELSQAVVWHTKFWQENANELYRPTLPSVSAMVMTGNNVIDFLESYGYVLPEKGVKNNFDLETMITVADQFDIGISWDRTFAGRVLPGRFCYGPVDISYWMSRSIFYPALIFENPALKQESVKLINGSKSIVKPYLGKLMNPLGTDLVVTRNQQEEDYKYPVLHTYNIYLYKFNEEASKHWGGVYSTADGIIPYETPSYNSIDDGAVPDKDAAYYPDIDETVVTPYYAKKAGYSNCFTTNFEKTIENLNRGVIMWMEDCHGSNGEYGSLGFWNPESPYIHEENPWRAYERPMLSPGGLKELFQYLPGFLEQHGLPSFKFLLNMLSLLFIGEDIITVDWGSTEDPDQTVMNPEFPISILNDAFRTDLHIKESNGLSLIPIIGKKYRSVGGDGVVIDPTLAGEIHLVGKNGIDLEEKLGNLHCCGFNAASCLIANTYMHNVMIKHGSPYQIADPWSTSWYSGVWFQNIPRQLALGYTIGQTYEKGMADVGVEYLVDQWWWDLNENVLFYGDPDLRVYVPSTEYSDKNNWDRQDTTPLQTYERLSLQGHMPFGADSYPNEKQPKTWVNQYLLVILSLITIIILLVVMFAIIKSNRRA